MFGLTENKAWHCWLHRYIEKWQCCRLMYIINNADVMGTFFFYIALCMHFCDTSSLLKMVWKQLVVNIKRKQNNCKQHLPIAKQKPKKKRQKSSDGWMAGFVSLLVFLTTIQKKNQKGIFIICFTKLHQAYKIFLSLVQSLVRA